MPITMMAVRRLQQMKMVLRAQNFNHLHVMRPYATKMTKANGAPEDGDFLQLSFSEINVNLLTTEKHCTDFIVYYNNLPSERKAQFLKSLAHNYGMDRCSVLSQAKSLTELKGQNDSNLLTQAERLRSALRPKHKTLFTHIGRVNGGVKFLVDLRADILNLKQGNLSEVDSALYQELNSTLRELLLLWFTVGFMNLERITWASPCDLVQKVSNYEAVHRIKTWADIKQRVGSYRRCYIFTHNAMPREPVVVLHTALTNEISSNIRSIIHNSRFRPSLSSLCSEDNEIESSGNPSTSTSSILSSNSTTLGILSPTSKLTTPLSQPQSPTVSTSFLSQAVPDLDDEKEDPGQIKCAVFYSITSTQKGLQGIEMGNYLIKSVVKKLQEEFPHLQQFSSLSPIPGFRDWLVTQVKHEINLRSIGENPGVSCLLQHERDNLQPFKQSGQTSPLDTFKDLITSHEWVRSVDLTRVMMGPLMRLCADYLYFQKRRSYALNPVANFHLSNGAMLWRINFLADTSHRGLTQSCTLMVNYRYYLDSTDTNSRNYLERHQIAVSPSVLNLLQSPIK